MDKYIQVGKPFIPYENLNYESLFEAILKNKVFILDDIGEYTFYYSDRGVEECAFNCISIQYAIQELKKQRDKIDERIAYLEKELRK